MTLPGAHLAFQNACWKGASSPWFMLGGEGGARQAEVPQSSAGFQQLARCVTQEGRVPSWALRACYFLCRNQLCCCCARCQVSILPPVAAIAVSAVAGPAADALLSAGMPVATVRKAAQVRAVGRRARAAGSARSPVAHDASLGLYLPAACRQHARVTRSLWDSQNHSVSHPACPMCPSKPRVWPCPLPAVHGVPGPGGLPAGREYDR